MPVLVAEPSSASYPCSVCLTPPPHCTTCRFFLTFEGADSYLGVWLNGTWVGMSKDSRLPAEWEVTHLVTPGDNLLAALVGDNKMEQQQKCHFCDVVVTCLE